MAYNLGVWSEREGGDWEACVISSYLEGLVYGGVTNFPLGVYTQEEREKLERIPDEPQDYNTTDVVAQARYGVHLRKLSTDTLQNAVTRVGIGLVLAGYGSLNIATNAPIHSIFYLPMNTGAGLVFDPLAANQSAGVLTLAAKVLKWAKGAGPNDAREVRKGEFNTVTLTTVKAEDWLPTQNPTGASNGVLRETPDKAAAIVARIPIGTPVRSIAEIATTAPAGDNNWRLTEYNSKPAYMLRRDWSPKVAGGDPKVDAEFDAFLQGKSFASDCTQAVKDATASLNAQIVALHGLIDNHVQAATKPENDLSKAAGIVNKS